MIKRYVVTPVPGQESWTILDRALRAFCALPGGKQPLTWETRQGAEQWLYMCRVAWGRDLVPAPDGWQAKPVA